MYMQVRFLSVYNGRPKSLTVHLGVKEYMNNKNLNFNIKTSKESNRKIRKVKNTCNVQGKPFKRDEKPWQVKDKIFLS